jgi:ABC-type nitrate/sulfonate/bicarbonate transport system substrate-binding protein
MLVLCAAAGILAGTPGAGVGAPGPVTVKVAFTPLQSWGPLFIAEQEGFFAREGIKIEWVTFAGGTDTVAVLIQGSLDVGAGAASAGFMNAVARRERIRIVADKGHVGPGFKEISVVVRKGLRPAGAATVADLRGRKIGINTTGSIIHYVLAKTLARGGMSLNQVETVRLPFPAIVTALQQGAVDAAVLAEPFVTLSVQTGAAEVLLPAGQVVPDEPVAFIFYGPNLLDRSPDVGRRFMLAYLHGLREYVKGPTEKNVRIIAEATKVPLDVIRKGGWFPIAVDGRVNINAIRRFQDWLYEQDFIGVRNPASTLVDLSFLDYAVPRVTGR